MYLTIKEAAEYLSITEEAVQSLIQTKRIRAVFDGESVYNNFGTKL